MTAVSTNSRRKVFICVIIAREKLSLTMYLHHLFLQQHWTAAGWTSVRCSNRNQSLSTEQLGSVAIAPDICWLRSWEPLQRHLTAFAFLDEHLRAVASAPNSCWLREPVTAPQSCSLSRWKLFMQNLPGVRRAAESCCYSTEQLSSWAVENWSNITQQLLSEQLRAVGKNT